MTMECCWLNTGNSTCGAPAGRWGNFFLCPEHQEAHRQRMIQNAGGTARQSAQYHDLSAFPGFCYFAALPFDRSRKGLDAFVVKIGYSNTRELVDERMKSLTRQYDALVKPMLIIPGGFVAEAVMHDRFRESRLPGAGERFTLLPDIAQYLLSRQAQASQPAGT